MENSKHAISRAIAAFLAMSSLSVLSAGPAMAAGTQIQAPKISAQQAESIARSTFHIPSSYQVQNQSFQQASTNAPFGATSTYSFNFAPAGQGPSGSIYVTLDANTGRVVDYNQNQYPGPSFQFPVPTSASDAQTIAMNWAKQLYPSQYPQTKLFAFPSQQNSLRYPISYQFNFERIVNGIPAPFDGFSITIDQTGTLTQVHDQWSNVSFPAANADISSSQANDIYKSALDLHLSYTQLWPANQQPSTILSFQPSTTPSYGWNLGYGNQYNVTGPVINGSTGRWQNSDGSQPTVTPYQKPTSLVPGGPMQDPLQIKVDWNEQQALTYAEKVLTLSSDAVLTSASQSQAQQNDQTWYFNWQTKQGKNIYATVDATHGFLQNFNEWTINTKTPPVTPQQPGKPLSAAALLADASAFLKQVLPNDTGAVTLNVIPMQGQVPAPTSNYQVTVLVNGIPDSLESGSLNVNASTGEIMSFWFNSSNQKDQSLPLPATAISSTAAKTIWMANHPLQLMYLETNPTMGKAPMLGPIGPNQQSAQPTIVLAYAPTTANNLGILNAVSGKFETSGQPVAYAGPINDLKGVAAAPQIQLLVQRGLLNVDAQGDVHPDITMTNSAFVKLLIDSMQLTQFYNQFSPMNNSTAAVALARVPSASPNYQEIQAAYAIGLIPQSQQFQPDTLITRTQAAQLIARVLGLEPLLSHPAEFTFSPADKSQISNTDLAADALANMFGIFTLQNGNFNPNADVSLADAAVAVVQAANIGAQMNLSNNPRPLP
ncbi:MAG: hypothetical protein A2201_06345 [Alicyclobacillus sp. RIFOXYA1_FULL_53_8]|nr:MAG: hypothetical protein A2201_06345 [Alicyclobacillus sp. RIFOXYA1_FULL_53_8]